MATEENKKARNLSVVSFLTILYVLGGGHFSSGSFLGGSVIFSRPEILEYAGLTLLLFYLYRFWLTSKFFMNVQIRRDEYLRKSEKLGTVIRGMGMKEIKDRLETTGEIEIGNQTFKRGTSECPVNAHWSSSSANIVRKNFDRVAIVTLTDRSLIVRGDIQIKLPWKCWLPHELLATLKAITLKEEFWDDIFPYLLCFGALSLVLLRRYGISIY